MKGLNIANNAGLSEQFLINQCFLSVYSMQILSILGFNSFENLKFVDKINGNSINWNMGYLISELNNDEKV